MGKDALSYRLSPSSLQYSPNHLCFFNLFSSWKANDGHVIPSPTRPPLKQPPKLSMRLRIKFQDPFLVSKALSDLTLTSLSQIS